jgi:hypothetical protein
MKAFYEGAHSALDSALSDSIASKLVLPKLGRHMHAHTLLLAHSLQLLIITLFTSVDV